MTSEAEDGNVFGDDQGRCFVRGGTLFGGRRTRGARWGRRGCRCCMGNAAGFGNLPATSNSPRMAALADNSVTHAAESYFRGIADPTHQ